nr:T9SS type A sorting domain-containing protein [Bacteroidota bacterium]
SFSGTLLAKKSIAAGSGAAITGRLLGGAVDATGTVTLDNATILPVEIVSFTAAAHRSAVELKWSTATEVNNFGFEIQRSAVTNGAAENTWSNTGFVEGNGTTNAPKSYSFIDHPLSSGKYSYRLKQIDRDGAFEYSQSVEVNIETIPEEYSLLQNHPNPFNSATTIQYQLASGAAVRLTVYDMVGKEAAVLVNEVKEAGSYSVQFDASHLASGIYFYRITAGKFTAAKKLVLVK